MSEALRRLESIIHGDSFSVEDFNLFFREKSRDYIQLDQRCSNYEDEEFKDIVKLGKIKFPDGDSRLICFSIKVLNNLTERAGKKKQYEKAKRILKSDEGGMNSTGIFIFYDSGGSFRFSLIYSESFGTRNKWSNFRRFTYFVDKSLTNKTFKHQIGEGDFSTLEAIKDAFSVEKVTKEFYQAIANWYFWVVGLSQFPKDAEAEEGGRNISIIRLITRIIFIWFMRERGLVSKDLFDKTSIKQILKHFDPLDSEDSNYYKAILQNLFFATLSAKKEERKFRTEQRGYKGYNRHFGYKYVFRYHALFKNPDKIKDIFDDTPFLNGGLFECLDDRKKDVFIDGFTDVKKHQPTVPNLLFFSDEKAVDLNKFYGTKNKTHKVRGLLNTLSSFNFTIDENTPDDQDVALDPELLGRVFENLLASFNPQTSTTARKATGSYYTPRKIVDYMVTESLKAYLKTSLENEGIEDVDGKLKSLFIVDNEENPFDERQSRKLVDLIESVRIVDPAVGSGAFPMGVLNKLVFILNKVDPDNKLWKSAQLKVVDAISDPSARRKARESIEKFFEGKNADYGRKLYLIQRCIYGVDIQQIAVEIAKLRFFISLLVDERIDKDSYNHGIEPLPNLDFKIMQGNSLIELISYTITKDRERDEIVRELKKLKDELFSIALPEAKRNKRDEIERLTEKLFERDRSKKIEEYELEIKAIEAQDGLFEDSGARRRQKENEKKINEYKLKIERIRNLQVLGPADHFEWHIYFSEVFQENEGFDIVIGNPPYGVKISQANLKAIKANIRDTKNTNSAALFADYAKNRFINKDGVVSLIVPKSLLFSERWLDLAFGLLPKTVVLVDVEKAFERVKLEQVVLIWSAKCNDNFYIGRKFLNNTFMQTTQINRKYPKKFQAWICSVSEVEIALGSKISSIGTFLRKVSKTSRGLAIQKDLAPTGDIPVLGGKEIRRYAIRGIKGYISREHLDMNSRKVQFLLQPKVISQRLVAHIQNPQLHVKIISTVDKVGDILSVDTVENTVITDEIFSPVFISSLFNSVLINWYAYRFIFCSAIRTMDFDNYYVGKIPVPIVMTEQQAPIIALATDILAAKAADPNADTTALEGEVDRLIYGLYGLTEEEIAVVEKRE